MDQDKSRILLVIGSVFPEPNSSAAGWRMLQLLELFREQDFQIHFWTTAQESEFSADLTALNISSKQIQLNHSSFDESLRGLQPDVVLFDRFYTEEQFSWRVAEICPTTLRMLDTEDLHCLRLARQKAVKENRSLEHDDLFSDLAKREIAAIYRSDLSLIISEYEFELLQHTFQVPSQLLHYLPLFANQIEKPLPDFNDRSDFIFAGNFLHEPNWDALRYLKEKIWTGIRSKLPGVKLHVFGAYASEKVLQLNNESQGFIVHGRAENMLDELKKRRVLLAPLRFGAGIKGKLLEAMLCGTASITTSIGAEGMHGTLPWNGVVTDSDEEFIQAALDFYSDQIQWEQGRKNGFHLIQARFRKELFADSFDDRMTDLREHLLEHRQKNFTGAMLLHHTMQSTKYLSKWIEQKTFGA